MTTNWSLGKLLIWGAISLGIIVALFVGYIVYTVIPKSPGLRYEFSEAFGGWVVIQYGDPRSSALPVRDGFFVLQIPPSGCFRTSTPIPEGFRTRIFEYVAADGRRTEIRSDDESPANQIWSHVAGGLHEAGGKKFVREKFFVGSSREAQQAPRLPAVTEHMCKELD